MNIEVRENFDAKNLTSFKVSSIIKRAYFPKNINELAELLQKIETPIILGNCSNVLLSSSGIDRNVIFTTNCKNITVNNTQIVSECGVKGPMASKIAEENSLSGFEFMIGFPGSIGGEIYMNASAKGQAISDYLKSVKIFDMDLKKILTLTKQEMEFDYRCSICQRKNYVILSADFELEQKNKELINEKMKENLSFRREHQPSLTLPNCGSVFKNPQNNSAGKLLDEAGAKNFNINGAKVWENHANFIINENNANSEDILNLMLLMYNKVKEKYNIKLVPELKYYGDKSENEAILWKKLQQK